MSVLDVLLPEEPGCFGFAVSDVPAVGGYALLPGLAAVASDLAAWPGSCKLGYLPEP